MRKRFAIAGVLVVAAIAVLIYFGFQWGNVYYYTVAEIKENSMSLSGKDVRVAGEVANGTVEWEDEDVVLRFTLVENDERLDVVYYGVFSDVLQGGQDVVVEGIYNDGILKASTIMTKCPSKYVPRE